MFEHDKKRNILIPDVDLRGYYNNGGRSKVIFFKIYLIHELPDIAEITKILE